jgi:hypothetical protein
MRPPIHPRYWYAPFEVAEKTDLTPLALEATVDDVGLVIAAAHTRADPDTVDNDLMRDVIGNKEDTSFSDFAHHPSIIGHLKASYYHVHGNSFTIPDNAPITVTPGNGAYVYGAPVEIGSYATTVYDVHWLQVSDIDNNGYYNLQLCNVDGTAVYGKTSCFRTNNFTQEGNVPIQISPVPKGTTLYARLGVSTGNISHTVAVKLFCHPYNDLT